jgi:general secretion pathway protein D
MLAGLIRDDERNVVNGVPGLSDMPLIGRLFAFNRKQTQETDIVLTLTPRIIRVLELTEADLRPFRVSRDGGPPVLELPTPPELPRVEPQVPGQRPPGDVEPDPNQPTQPIVVPPPAGQPRPPRPPSPPR